MLDLTTDGHRSTISLNSLNSLNSPNSPNSPNRIARYRQRTSALPPSSRLTAGLFAAVMVLARPVMAAPGAQAGAGGLPEAHAVTATMVQEANAGTTGNADNTGAAGTAGTASAAATAGTAGTAGNPGSDEGHAGGRKARDQAPWSVGLGIASLPSYPGSRERDLRVFPALDLRYGRWYLGAVPEAGTPVGLGVDLFDHQTFRLGIGLSTELSETRRERDADRIRGLGDVDATQRLHLYLVRTRPHLRFSLGVATDIGGKHLGTQASASWQWLAQPWANGQLAIGPRLSWANRQAQNTVYGVDAMQSAASGLAFHRPDGGLARVGLSATLAHRFTPRWSAALWLQVDRLMGDAADSPIVERRHQPMAALIASYHF